MKDIIRYLTGILVGGPFILMTYLLSVFIGKERAVRIVGPILTSIAKVMLGAFIPKIKDASEFDKFSPGMKKNFWLWKPFYDFDVAQEDSNVFKLKVYNCPFCEVVIKSGLPELGPHICQGDWEIAKENKDKWTFMRTHQIGTGDRFCDHTYLRKHI